MRDDRNAPGCLDGVDGIQHIFLLHIKVKLHELMVRMIEQGDIVNMLHKALSATEQKLTSQIQPHRDALLPHDILEFRKEHADLFLGIVKAVFHGIMGSQDQRVRAVLPGRVEHLQRCLHTV